VTLAIAITAVILSLPHYWADADEPKDERVMRSQYAADVIVEVAGDNRDMIAALIALGWHESRWSRYVYEDRCQDGKPGEQCDEGRAKSPWQMHKDACPGYWKSGLLSDGARCAHALLRYGRAVCGNWAGAFAVYAGQRCSWSGGIEREATRQRMLVKLRREMANP
jgi:hypothetical protein